MENVIFFTQRVRFFAFLQPKTSLAKARSLYQEVNPSVNLILCGTRRCFERAFAIALSEFPTLNNQITFHSTERVLP